MTRFLKKFIKSVLSRFLWKLDEVKFYYLYNKYRKIYNIHPSFIFNGKYIYFYGEGDIIIDENSYIGQYSSIQAGKGCHVKIGKIAGYLIMYEYIRLQWILKIYQATLLQWALLLVLLKG